MYNKIRALIIHDIKIQKMNNNIPVKQILNIRDTQSSVKYA